MYRRAFVIGIAVLAFGILCAFVRYLDDKLKRKRKANEEAQLANPYVKSQSVGQEDTTPSSVDNKYGSTKKV